MRPHVAAETERNERATAAKLLILLWGVVF
jgi:hypothetical protein